MEEQVRDCYLFSSHSNPSYWNTTYSLGPGPDGQCKPIIFMQHGLECDSTNWIANLPENSAGKRKKEREKYDEGANKVM